MSDNGYETLFFGDLDVPIGEPVFCGWAEVTPELLRKIHDGLMRTLSDKE